MRRRGYADLMAELPANEADWTHSPRRPSPKRPWRCDECGIRFSYEWTLRRHEAIHQAYLPPTQKQLGQRTGTLACTACPARYDEQGDLDRHHQARHPWMRTA